MSIKRKCLQNKKGSLPNLYRKKRKLVRKARKIIIQEARNTTIPKLKILYQKRSSAFEFLKIKMPPVKRSFLENEQE